MSALKTKSSRREVMDVRQTAEYLGISKDTVYQYAQEGFIPAFRLGNRWKFRTGRLEEWMDERAKATGDGQARTEAK